MIRLREEIENSLDLVLVVGLTADLRSNEFIQMMNVTLFNQKVERSILSYLEEKFKSNEEKFPAFMYWTINTYLSAAEVLRNIDVHISQRVVAPAYRKKGLMKNLSLSLLRSISASLEGFNCRKEVSAIPIHPATYRFFNPNDTACKHYFSGGYESVEIETLLAAHGYAAMRKIVSATYVPSGMNGFFSPFNEVNKKLAIMPREVSSKVLEKKFSISV